MIIHGSYAKFLRENGDKLPDDIDLFATVEQVDNLCALLVGDSYICHRGKTLVPNREVVLLLPRNKQLLTIKFDIEIVSHSLHETAWHLADTVKTNFMGLSIGIISPITDIIMKEEVMVFSHPKHFEYVMSNKHLLGEIDTTLYKEFRSAWATHIIAKYGPKGNRQIYNTQLASTH